MHSTLTFRRILFARYGLRLAGGWDAVIPVYYSQSKQIKAGHNKNRRIRRSQRRCVTWLLSGYEAWVPFFITVSVATWHDLETASGRPGARPEVRKKARLPTNASPAPVVSTTSF